MALILCPECNKEVSDKAEVCIHCGYPLRNTICLIKGDKYDLSFVFTMVNTDPELDRIYKEGYIRKATAANGYNIGSLNAGALMDLILKTGIIPESFELPYPEYIKYLNSAITCPTCKSTNVAKIGAGERAASVGLLGIFSKKINKSYKCNNCGYTW